MKRTLLPLLAAAAMTLLGSTTPTQAQGTAFTYQGRLDAGDAPVNGLYDFEFHLYSTASGGGPLTGGTTVNGYPVTNGLFTVTLDFLNSFPGTDRWLDIAVRPSGAPTFNTLTPRQKITPTPYAITAANLSGTLPSSGLSGAYNSQVTLFNPANQINGSFNGTFTGNGAGVSNVNAAQLNGLTSANFWHTNGNLNANPTNGAFVGTRDNLPLEMRVNGQRAMRFEPQAPFFGGAPSVLNVVGGSVSNQVLNGSRGVTIAGGGPRNSGEHGNLARGDFAVISGGRQNSVLFHEGTVAGGRANTSDGFSSSVGGGYTNSALGHYATVAGGVSNLAAGVMATVAGGMENTASGVQSTVSGGSRNQANGGWTTVIGGTGNSANGTNAISGGFTSIASGNSAVAIGHVTTAAGSAATALGNSTRAIGGSSFAAGLATTAGGNSSTALGELTDASGFASTAIGYGTRASGTHSTAMGWGSEAAGNFSIASGYASKTAGERTFAAGTRAYATNLGSFVWADASAGLGTNGAFGSTGTNQFLIRAQGGVGINTNNPQAALHVNGTIIADNFTGSGAGLNNIWKTGGNAGTTAGTHFLGTTDGQPLEFKVAGERAMRLEPGFGISPNVIGGASINRVEGFTFGATIAGGGDPGIGEDNVVGGAYGTVGGGRGNTVRVAEGTIAGGRANTTDGLNSTVSGGYANSALSDYSVVSGGEFNTASGSASTIGGGVGNLVTNTPSATVSGGAFNRIEVGADYGTIGGGAENVVLPAAHFATIPGGRQNTATNYAFAAGNRAKAIHPGAFVWSDTVDADFASTGQDQFLIRAGGGVGINTSNPGGAALAVNGNQTITGNVGIGTDSPVARLHINGGPSQSGIESYATANQSAIYGENTSGTGGIAVAGRNHSPGYAVYGDNNDTTGWAGYFTGRLYAGGSVGIGTDNPQAPLDVAGDARVNGTATATTVAASTVSVSGALRVPGAGVGTTGPAFVHRVTAGNIDPAGTHRTTINHPLCNGDPNAILMITYNYSPSGGGGGLNTHPTSVYYEPNLQKWQIYHDNNAAMVVGKAWNVLVIKP